MASRLFVFACSFLWLIVSAAGEAATFETVFGQQRFLLCSLSLGTPDPPVVGCTTGSFHPYDGPQLESEVVAPGSELSSASLRFADLSEANLAGSRFSFSELTLADFSESDLTGSDFSGASFRYADVDGADFSGADLSDARYLGTAKGSAIYSPTTNFSNAWWDSGGLSCLLTDRCTPFDPVAAGWTLVVPEPATSLLLGLGLLMLGVVGRPQRNRVAPAAQPFAPSVATSSNARAKSPTISSRSSLRHT